MSKSVWSYIAKAKVTLTDSQLAQYNADTEKAQQQTRDNNALAQIRTEPYMKILEQEFEGNLDEWEKDTIKQLKQELVENSKEIIKWSNDTRHLESRVRYAQELETKLRTIKDCLHRSIRAIRESERAKFEQVKYPDPFDYLTDSKKKEYEALRESKN